TLDDALESIGRMVALGIRTIVTTPHFDASLMSGPHGGRRMEEVETGFARLEEAVARRFPEIELGHGFEVMLDDPHADLSDSRLRMAGTRFVLVEWPRMRVPPGTSAVLARLRDQGLTPVVAHPERYREGGDVRTLAQSWREAGAFLQVNHGSLTGRYGAAPERRAWSLLEEGLVDYLASDHHGRPHLDLQLDEVERRLEDFDAEEQLGMLVRTNPLRLLEDQEPLPVRPVQVSHGWRERLRRLIRPEVS
ncbi:MAG TPA: CpsB/CapC family capsule biosynthesis tyrosine phosphatase, partial [Longimicrobiales bacterium]|nr:CpsB/CapC family capsule biosynthesis tyrosine phosphatase [Longimicrobiales bacterium]